ncbi:hypothetical protein APU02_01010 [Citrobacter sp. 50677481]|nr:hypothetical protein APU02_01010 [Citrobacter sp. 50677481]
MDEGNGFQYAINIAVFLRNTLVNMSSVTSSGINPLFQEKINTKNDEKNAYRRGKTARDFIQTK